MLKKILIAGATGLIGKRLLASLAGQYHCCIVSRYPNPLQGVTTVTWEQFQKHPDRYLDRVDAVINLAGASVAKRWTSAVKKEIYTSRIETTKWVVQAINRATVRPRVFICASAIGYYNGSDTAAVHTEASGPGPGYMSQLCKAWEDEAKQALCRVVSLRIGLVLAPEKGFLPLIKRPFLWGVGGHIGTGKQGAPWIHYQDMVAIIKMVLHNDHIQGALNAVAPNTVSLAAFCTVLGTLLNRKSWFHLPPFAARIVLGEMATSILETPHVSPKTLIEHGFAFRYPQVEDALKACLSENPRV